MFVLAIPTFSDILNDYSIFCKIYGSGLFFLIYLENHYELQLSSSNLRPHAKVLKQ